MSIEQRDRPQNDVEFQVEIKSGGRAYDPGSPAGEARTLSPVRAAAKEQKRRRTVLTGAVVLVALLALAAWAWLSNPNTNVPATAVARVNGEYIYEADITREIDLTKLDFDLSKQPNATAPSRASVLESLITLKTQVQDAKKAGVAATPAELDADLQQRLDQTGLTQPQLVAALAKYNLTLDDLRALRAGIVARDRYVAEVVTAGAKTSQERQNRINDWLTQLSQTSKVDRLRSPGEGAAPRVGAPAPDFALKALDGKEYKLSDLKGKPVMLNFWATWCPPCRAEIPTIVQTYKAGPAGAFEVLGVATQSDRGTVQAFAQEFGINYPVLPDADNRVTDLYHVLPIPTTFFIDKDGVIRDMQVGVVDAARMEKWLRPK